MIDYTEYFAFLKSAGLADISNELEAVVNQYYKEVSHGDLDRWLESVSSLPQVKPSTVNLDIGSVQIGTADDIAGFDRQKFIDNLMQLHPWRKGPFNLFGIGIDTEWRSDLKWARLKEYINLDDKLILDVGCGNGYYMLRMLAAGARAVVGIDPTLLFVIQFEAINKYVRTNAARVLPLKLEDMPKGAGGFDTVFSMGILYHRRDPKEHIDQLLSFLKPCGKLVLETIVLDKPGKENLVPAGRYAKMRNVWNIPTVELLVDWLVEAGCRNVEVAAIEKTTQKEQRKTNWMTFESLEDFLDPTDHNKTIEGHPAPVRAVIIADN